LLLLKKRQADTFQATTRSTKLATKRLPGAAPTSGIQPDLKPFLDGLADLLAATVTSDLKPRLRLRHRPVERVKPVLRIAK